MEPKIQGFLVISGTRIILPTEVSTIDASVLLPSVGTIGTIASPVNITGQITVGSITGGVINSVGTVGTIASPVSVIGSVSISNVPAVTSQYQFKMTNILSYPFGSIYGGVTTSTLIAGSLQSLVVDISYGTVLAGNISTYVLGVDPQTGLITGTIVSGSWYSGTVVATERLVASGPLGYEIAIQVNCTGSISGVYVTAEQSP